MSEDYAAYLALQYGPDVAERYRAIASSPKPLRFAPTDLRPPEQICPECGKKFSNRKRKYCSEECSKKVNARRCRELIRRKRLMKEA